MRSGLRLLVFAVSLFSGACSLIVSFDDPAEPTCDMMPPDCSVEACLETPECQPQPCSVENVYYDSPPSCVGEQECIYTETDGVMCAEGFYFSDGNFYDRCDQSRCPHGAVCIQGMVGSPDVCVPYCNVISHPRCPDGGMCYDTEDSPIIDVCFRDDNCDPVKNRGCSGGDGCFLIYNGATSCLPAGTKVAGDTCKIAWDCAGGFVCSDITAGDTFGTCLKVCEDPAQCALDETCVPIGIYGVCHSAVEPM